jgi:hypothetical protein
MTASLSLILRRWALAAIMILAGAAGTAFAACTGTVTVCAEAVPGAFRLISAGKPATVYVDADAATPTLRVAADFAADLERVSGQRAMVVHSLEGLSGDVVIIGQAGRSALVDRLVKGSVLVGQWEAYSQSVFKNPVKGVDRALVIAGSDPRGTVFGVYDISAKMGVSPWYWWADVPVKRQADVSVTAGERTDKPVVKYRGFFINDEEPAFGNWAREKFGGINSKLYAKVFELNLRLKGNYLWPAMWGKAIADDDPESLNVASQYGVILGTSHHEPMTRAQVEWHRHADGGVTGGKWDYRTNSENLRKFWRGGMERGKTHENIITLGMRGDGDEPMSEGTATALLGQIVADQRKIIEDVTGKPADQTPQVWALYKEVQDYYDHGMRVPDDVTLLFADDNWGQIRRLPDPKAPPRKGGYGIYYHFDYVGGPRNYKWLNTNQIEKTWQQMALAREAGADRLWIVNVGDIKPMEFPLSFFMDMAWNPDAMTPEALKGYPQNWARQQFGPEQAWGIGQLLTRSSQYAARRKPELLNPELFMADTDFRKMTQSYANLKKGAYEISAKLPDDAQDAWFQLVQHPIEANANLYELYDRVARNRRLAEINDPAANDEATAARWAFARDGQIAEQYHTLNGGKWNHMMSQTHIGYTYWQQPDTDVMPELKEVAADAKPQASINVSLPATPPVVGKTGHYVDQNGFVAMEAQHYARKFDGNAKWTTIPNLGRNLGAVLTLPQTAPASDPLKDKVRLEYDIQTSNDADATLYLYLTPTLDTAGKGGLKFAVSIDDLPPQTVSFNLIPDKPDWNKAVSDNIHIIQVPFKGLKAGAHTLKFYRIDGNVVLQRLVLDLGGLKPSYLGPPESAVAR